VPARELRELPFLHGVSRSASDARLCELRLRLLESARRREGLTNGAPAFIVLNHPKLAGLRDALAHHAVDDLEALLPAVVGRPWVAVAIDDEERDLLSESTRV
jgi:hypothetical protein